MGGGMGKERAQSIVVGPWGGNGGKDWDDGTHTGIRTIKLAYGQCIDSITVVYDNDGEPFVAEKHGGLGGNQIAEIKLQYPDEYIVSVSGFFGPSLSFTVLRSLMFITNKRTFGPFGALEGTPFTFEANGGHIVGFFGRKGWYIDAIGFHVTQPQSLNLPIDHKNDDNNRLQKCRYNFENVVVNGNVQFH